MLKVFYADNIDTLKLKGLHWADSFSTACIFDSNQYSEPYSAFDLLILIFFQDVLMSFSSPNRSISAGVDQKQNVLSFLFLELGSMMAIDLPSNEPHSIRFFSNKQFAAPNPMNV